jgi:hypothetical protein
MGRFYNALNFYRQNETSLTFAFNPKEATGFWMIVLILGTQLNIRHVY